MLRYLKINNFAIIDEIEVEFREGFNVLTGETGAGKSILIGALGLILGAKANQDFIRSGADEATVEALFEINEASVLPEDLKTDFKDSGELVISRRIQQNGRSRCSINGRLTALSALEKVGSSLVTVFGQHESHVLLNPDEHIEILDRSSNLGGQRLTVEQFFNVVRKAKGDLNSAKQKFLDLEAAAAEHDSMIQELAGSNLRVGEEDDLLQERDILRKASQIREKAYEAYQRLYSKSGSVISTLAEIKKWIQALVALHPGTGNLLENFEASVYQLEDIALELRNFTENTHDDPLRLEQIEERLAILRKLRKKYGGDIELLLEKLETLSGQANTLMDAQRILKDCEKRAEQAQHDFLDQARILSHERRKAAQSLEAAMRQELSDLAMKDAQFSVLFKDIPDQKSGPKGLEDVEFYLTSNPGEAARPLAKIASGGELSRVMLALKALEIDSTGQASTLVFDEVDAGIGGHTALAVGERLARVAKRQQTICITHLHQIAARADHHIAVRKFVKSGRTSLDATSIVQEERIAELTRMLGASDNAEPIRDHMRSLVNKAGKGL
jgi:DNA repair protein RecN (Recombination protein N)